MKNCENCGKVYHPRNGGSRFCPDCVKITQACPICGTVFTTYRADGRVTCSQKCGYAYQKDVPKFQNQIMEEPFIASIIAKDLYDGKTLKEIADRNKRDIQELAKFYVKKRNSIKRYFKMYAALEYPKYVNTEHRNPYVKNVHTMQINELMV